MRPGPIALTTLTLLWAVPTMAEAAVARAAPRAHVDTGWLIGAQSGPAEVFRAVPFAAPPVGPLRWKPPTPPARWNGDRSAIAAGPACPQAVTPGAPNLGGYSGPTREDCLTLDITAPLAAPARDGRRRWPVMVWVFGGGNVAGAPDLPSYDAVNFARDGVIVVAMNYRLGALGFFAHPALTAEASPGAPLGSYGVMDQIAALKWVKRNIAGFGGDAANVTLFGESAGGADVLQLLATPSARGLFRRAIVQSGGGWAPIPTLTRAEAAGSALAVLEGLPGASATAAQLRALSVESLLAKASDRLPAGGPGPIRDGRLIRQSPAAAFSAGSQAPVPLIIGSNSNEASLMHGGGPLARALFNDAVMGAPARWIAGKASAKAPAWLYYFSYVPERQRATRPGTNHASEIPFVFDSLDAVPGRTPLITTSERAEATLAHSCWVAFARSGVPTCAGGQACPDYSPAADQLLEFGEPPGVRTRFRKAQLDAQESAANVKAF